MIEDFMGYILFGLAVLILGVSLWIGASYMEMKAFNRHSDTKANLMDAMFSQLRIMSD